MSESPRGASRAGNVLTAIWRALGTPSDRMVERLVRWRLIAAIVAANLVGIAVVFVLGVWVLPTGDIDPGGDAMIVNLAAAAAYVLLATTVAVPWALCRLRPGRRWLQEERDPTPEEQRSLLRAPLHVLFLVASLWLVAAVAFGALNATYSGELGQRVALMVAFAGLTTGAVGYLLSERLLRPAAARALASRPPERPALPGVTGRTLFAWALGSGLPILGVVLLGVSTLVERDFSRTELAIAVVAIGAAALMVGFVATVLAAKVTADPIVSVRRALAEVEAGDLGAEVPVYDGTEVGMLQGGFNRMVAGLRERERIRDVFGRHVGEDVARGALEREGELAGEVREVSVLFVDVIGSTRLAAQRSPSDVVDLLNEFFSVVVDVVDRHGGGSTSSRATRHSASSGPRSRSATPRAGRWPPPVLWQHACARRPPAWRRGSA